MVSVKVQLRERKPLINLNRDSLMQLYQGVRIMRCWLEIGDLQITGITAIGSLSLPLSWALEEAPPVGEICSVERARYSH